MRKTLVDTRGGAVEGKTFACGVVTAQQLAALGAKGEASDGPAVAGLPSRMAKVAHPNGELEVYGVADATRSYAVFILVKTSANVEEFRQNAQPALLESVTLSSK